MESANKITVTEEGFDADLHIFGVYHDGKLLGKVYPADLDDMRSCISDLDEGIDPISGCWEDGCGNSCTMDGWGDSADLV